MVKAFVNRTLIFFQSVAIFLVIMLIVYIIAVVRMEGLSQCLMTICIIPVYLLILMVWVAGTLLSPIKVEVHDHSVQFVSIIPGRTKSIPYNRIREIELPREERSYQVVITDDHGGEHRFYMVNYRISREIIKRHGKFIRKEAKGK
ncbi:MAG: hypothetical protein ACMUHM_09080 [Thermoplasmatota archaeon]